MSRAVSRPSPSTWYRRIAAEKKRLLDAGVCDVFELHAVCVLLRRSEYGPASDRARRLLQRKGE